LSNPERQPWSAHQRQSLGVLHDDPAAARSGELRFASPPGGHRGAGAIVGRESSIDGRYRVLTGAAAASKTGSDVDQADVRFGSEADICAAKSDVRFTPNSDRESRHPLFAQALNYALAC